MFVDCFGWILKKNSTMYVIQQLNRNKVFKCVVATNPQGYLYTLHTCLLTIALPISNYVLSFRFESSLTFVKLIFNNTNHNEIEEEHQDLKGDEVGVLLCRFVVLVQYST